MVDKDKEAKSEALKKLLKDRLSPKKKMPTSIKEEDDESEDDKVEGKAREITITVKG